MKNDRKARCKIFYLLEGRKMIIDEKTFDDKSNIYMKVNNAYIPVEEVTEIKLKNISYIQIFIQKIKELIKSFWS